MAAFDVNENTPQTLCDWVKNFRIKKVQMKRKLRTAGGELRVCAILSRALTMAEEELRRKQQERFNRWLDLQNKLDHFGNNACDNNTSNEDDIPYIPNNENFHHLHHITQNGVDLDDTEIKRRSEITNLWKYELSGLDAFMKNISSSNQTCAVQS